MKQTHINALSNIINKLADLPTLRFLPDSPPIDLAIDAQTILMLESCPYSRRPITDPAYFDCECDTNYIHKKSAYSNMEVICPECGCGENDQPDSRLSEVVEMIVKKYQPSAELVSRPL